jgi:excinuclease UvrABC helicase subunit UvrB
MDFDFESQMRLAAERPEFERAAGLRDKMKELKKD